MEASKIRVAYILTPINFGGAEKVSLNFLTHVNKENFDIQPILLVRPWEEETYFGSELGRIGYAYKTAPVAFKTERDPYRVPRVAVNLYNYLKNGSYDLVHTHGYFADICGQLVARILGMVGISTCHGFIDTEPKLRLYNSLDKYVLRQCKAVIAVSEMIKDDLICSGLRNSRITVIPNAVSHFFGEFECASHRWQKRSLLHLTAGEQVVGYMGRLSVEKGVIHLLVAVHDLLKTGKRIRLVIVGDGPERKALERESRTLGISDKVTFTGFQSESETWYPAFDIFVLPSLTEGTPMALLESMAAGVPVIATAVGGVTKVLTENVNGFLVPPCSPSAITEKMEILLSDTELSSRLSRSGIKTIKTKFSISAWCRKIENCYTEALYLNRSSITTNAFRDKYNSWKNADM